MELQYSTASSDGTGGNQGIGGDTLYSYGSLSQLLELLFPFLGAMKRFLASIRVGRIACLSLAMRSERHTSILLHFYLGNNGGQRVSTGIWIV